MNWWNKPADVLKYSVVFSMVLWPPSLYSAKVMQSPTLRINDTNSLSALAQIPLYSNKTEPLGGWF